MPAERRGQVIAVEIGSTGNGRNPTINGGRQPSCGDTSRMNREVHVRICERLGVKLPGATRPRSGSAFAAKGDPARPESAGRRAETAKESNRPGAGSAGHCLN